MIIGWGALMIVFSATVISQRLFIKAEGVVVDKEVQCAKPLNNRCKSIYTLAFEDGFQNYTAGPNDHSLSREIQIGSELRKNQWEIDYKIDNDLVNDFPSIFYAVILLLGFSVSGIGYVYYLKGNK